MVMRVILMLLLAMLLAAPVGVAQERPITIRYFGQAFFLITTPEGTRIAIDPYGQIGYPLPAVEGDLVLVTHEHGDHNNIGLVRGTPRVLRGLAAGAADWNRIYERIGAVLVYSVPAFHDNEQGTTPRGLTAMFVIEAGGLRIAHLGDLGQVALSDGQVRAMGAVDILMVPVGDGPFTIGAAEATRVAAQLRPKVIIPMHYKTAATDRLPLVDEQQFLAGKQNVRRLGSSTLTISRDQLPAASQIVVMDYR
jgi:L-ascorbate metabolism protein UlaG (beta-lactamase superfamily)